jgi:hypothetical protein
VSALNELQQRRQADGNRTAGAARATAKRRRERVEELRCEVENCQHQRDEAMRAARNTRQAFAMLPPEQLREAVGIHAYLAHCHNRAAVRLLIRSWEVRYEQR